MTATITQSFTIDVRGTPVPQGSIKVIPMKHDRTKFTTKYADNVWDWRRTVQAAIMAQDPPPFTGSVELRLGFDMPRIASHYLPVNSRRSERELKPDAPLYPTVAPDLDKLIRAINDSCTDAGLWHDDAQVASIIAAKRYADVPGVLIQVTAL